MELKKKKQKKANIQWLIPCKQIGLFSPFLMGGCCTAGRGTGSDTSRITLDWKCWAAPGAELSLLGHRAWLCVPGWMLLLCRWSVYQRNLGNVFSSLCCAVHWVRERRMSPAPPHYHCLFSASQSCVFKRRVNCFAFILQWYCLFKLPRGAAILYVQAMTLGQVARACRNPKALLVLHDRRLN